MKYFARKPSQYIEHTPCTLEEFKQSQRRKQHIRRIKSAIINWQNLCWLVLIVMSSIFVGA